VVLSPVMRCFYFSYHYKLHFWCLCIYVWYVHQ